MGSTGLQEALKEHRNHSCRGCLLRGFSNQSLGGQFNMNGPSAGSSPKISSSHIPEERKMFQQSHSQQEPLTDQEHTISRGKRDTDRTMGISNPQTQGSLGGILERSGKGSEQHSSKTELTSKGHQYFAKYVLMRYLQLRTAPHMSP